MPDSESVLHPDDELSYRGLEALVYYQLMTDMEKHRLISRYYLSTVKALDYTLLDDKEIVICSHAPMQFDLIRFLANALRVAYDDTTREKLAQTIDAINFAFNQYVLLGAFYEKFFKAITSIKYPSRMSLLEMEQYPFISLVWNLWFAQQKLGELRPKVINGYTVQYVHEHDLNRSESEQVLNLATWFGRHPLGHPHFTACHLKVSGAFEGYTALLLYDSPGLLDKAWETVLDTEGCRAQSMSQVTGVGGPDRMPAPTCFIKLKGKRGFFKSTSVDAPQDISLFSKSAVVAP
jgi:hypothetical protein